MRWYGPRVFTLVVLVLAWAGQASADTVTFQGPKSTSHVSEDYYVGPYLLSVSGLWGGSTFDATCFRADLDVGPPSVWSANVYRGDAVTFPSSWAVSPDQLQAGAWLDSQFYASTYQWADIHHALWALFQPGSTTGDPFYTYSDGETHHLTDKAHAAALSLYGEAKANAGSVSLNSFYVVLPDKVSPETGAYPQPFITRPSPPLRQLSRVETPEPSSLALMLAGSGVLALRRRRRKA